MRTKASANRPMYCGEVASAAGVSADTVRHYERLGLLRTAQRSVAGYRLFPSDALNRVRLIQGALALGFSLKELAAILGERDRGGTPCRKVRKLAAKKLDELEVRLREMQKWRRELRGTLALWDRTLRKTRSGQRAGLLETFAATHPDRRTRRSERYVLPNGNDKREKRQ